MSAEQPVCNQCGHAQDEFENIEMALVRERKRVRELVAANRKAEVLLRRFAEMDTFSAAGTYWQQELTRVRSLLVASRGKEG